MFSKQIEPQDYESLLEGLSRGEYHLLLGAGASLGALGGDGFQLPNTSTLIKELVDNFVIDTNGVTIDLRDAYEFIQKKNDTKGRTRAQYFQYRFSKCTPAWHEILADIYWRKIWTLNIDDVVEQAYKRLNGSTEQNAKPYNWNSLYSEPDFQTKELQIIHLHGFAPILDDKRSPLIFSILEYLQATSRSGTWHRIFGDEYLQRPFIIVGAKLTDEYDLAEILRRGNRSKATVGKPSLIILKDIPNFKKEQFREWGLIPIEIEAQEFFNYINKDLVDTKAKLAKTVPHLKLTTEAQTFLHQYQGLRVDKVPLIPPKHDFYQGDEPLWADIIAERDARLELVDTLLSSINTLFTKSLDNKSQNIYCISGIPGSGKSTLLLRVGRELVAQGYDVFLFRGEERLDISSTCWWLGNSPKTVLLVDGIADFASDFGKLSKLCLESNINLFCITTERERRIQYVYKDIDPEFLHSGKDYRLDLLSNADIDRLLNKLRDAHRMGVLTRKSLDEQRRYFRKVSNRQLLVAMSRLEGGRGFINKIRDEYSSDISNPEMRSIYALSCITYNLGYPLPFGVACTALAIKSETLSQALTNELIGLIYVDNKGLRPRHRVIASIVINNILQPHEIYELTLNLSKTLSPYITPNTIRQRTLHYRIVRLLMDEGFVCDLLGARRARDWYADLEQFYEWNARYWEQRALVEVRNFNFPRARSYAEQALQIHRHPFTMNTLGSILTLMAIEHFIPGSAEAREIFWEGVGYLKDSRKREGTGIHPYATFFNRALNYARKLKEKGLTDQKLFSEWQHWIDHAKMAVVFKHLENNEQLQDFQSQWISLAISPT